MAFWKKSEDPWDMKPKSVGTVNPVTPDRDEEPESLLESVRDWAEKKRSAEKDQLTLPPEKCPWCGGEMEQGFLNGGYFPVERAMEMLTFEGDREILKNALEIYQRYLKTIA